MKKEPYFHMVETKGFYTPLSKLIFPPEVVEKLEKDKTSANAHKVFSEMKIEEVIASVATVQSLLNILSSLQLQLEHILYTKGFLIIRSGTIEKSDNEGTDQR